MPGKTPEKLEVYLQMTSGELARLVLCLIVEDMLRGRLAAFRAEHLAPQPVEGLEEFGIVGLGVMAFGHAPGGVGQEISREELVLGVPPQDR